MKAHGLALLAVGAALAVGALGFWLLSQSPGPVPRRALVYRVAGRYPTPVVSSDASWLGVLRPGDIVLDRGETHASLRHVAGHGWNGWVIEADLAGPMPPLRGASLAGLSQAAGEG